MNQLLVTSSGHPGNFSSCQHTAIEKMAQSLRNCRSVVGISLVYLTYALYFHNNWGGTLTQAIYAKPKDTVLSLSYSKILLWPIDLRLLPTLRLLLMGPHVPVHIQAVPQDILQGPQAPVPKITWSRFKALIWQNHSLANTFTRKKHKKTGKSSK